MELTGSGFNPPICVDGLRKMKRGIHPDRGQGGGGVLLLLFCF